MPRFTRRLRLLASLTLLTALLAGCAGVKVSSIEPADYLAQRRSDVLTSGQLSPATQESLRVIGLNTKACLAAPQTCRDSLGQASGLYDEQRMAALAELWTLQAMRSDRLNQGADAATDPMLEIDAWIEAARHAWAYLFFTPRSPSQRAFEDRQTQVRDYYNYAVQQAITGLFELNQVQSLDALQRSAHPIGRWMLDTDLSGVWLPTDKHMPRELLPAASLTFSGLRNQYRRDGFGAELVAVFDNPYPASDIHPQIQPPAYQEALFPALTGLLRFEGDDLKAVLSTRHVQLQVLDPYRFSHITLADNRVPLAGNFTSGYGLWLARSGFSVQALRSLIGVSNGIVRPRIYLMQPYDPKRRIILMLHGLASSPEAWINVANEMLGDETLRRNYQIWQVYYPTNAPLALNNRAIRDVLQTTLAHFDPKGQAPASDQITLVGHSMGGVLARLMVSNTQDQLWASITDAYGIRPDGPDGLGAKLKPYLEFQAIPQVRSAIFIAAPHRGTDLANNRIARWISNLITLPFSMVVQLSDITRSLAQASPRIGKQSLLRIPNSIDNLSDADPYIRLAAELPISDQVRYHSIIGNTHPELPLPDSSDGIVPYRSAHLPDAASELVVRFGHSVQEHPQAIVEIRRILHEQLSPEKQQ